MALNAINGRMTLDLPISYECKFLRNGCFVKEQHGGSKDYKACDPNDCLVAKYLFVLRNGFKNEPYILSDAVDFARDVISMSSHVISILPDIRTLPIGQTWGNPDDCRAYGKRCIIRSQNPHKNEPPMCDNSHISKFQCLCHIVKTVLNSKFPPVYNYKQLAVEIHTRFTDWLAAAAAVDSAGDEEDEPPPVPRPRPKPKPKPRAPSSGRGNFPPPHPPPDQGNGKSPLQPPPGLGQGGLPPRHGRSGVAERRQSMSSFPKPAAPRGPAGQPPIPVGLLRTENHTKACQRKRERYTDTVVAEYRDWIEGARAAACRKKRRMLVGHREDLSPVAD